MEKETWRPIPGYEGLYEVSDMGRVRSLARTVVMKNGRPRPVKSIILKSADDKDGYQTITLCKSQKKTYRVHKLVAIAFLSHMPNGHTAVVDHINNNPKDNNVQNIRVVTQRVNTLNRKSKKKSSFAGAHYNKRNNKWYSEITIDGKRQYLGCFNYEIEAAEAYQRALQKIE